jgi:hypothetical protein
MITMSKQRISDEEVVVHFFNTAEPAKATTVFNIVKGIMRHRGVAADTSTVTNGSGARKSAAGKSNGSGKTAAKSTSAPPVAAATTQANDLPL